MLLGSLRSKLFIFGVASLKIIQNYNYKNYQKMWLKNFDRVFL